MSSAPSYSCTLRKRRHTDTHEAAAPACTARRAFARPHSIFVAIDRVLVRCHNLVVVVVVVEARNRDGSDAPAPALDFFRAKSASGIPTPPPLLGKGGKVVGPTVRRASRDVSTKYNCDLCPRWKARPLTPCLAMEERKDAWERNIGLRGRVARRGVGAVTTPEPPIRRRRDTGRRCSCGRTAATGRCRRCAVS